METTWIGQLILLLIIVAVFGFGIYFFSPARAEKQNKKNAMPNEDQQGKDLVLRQLHRFAATNDFKVIRPVSIQQDRYNADLDALLIGWFGVLGVKCIGYNGTIYGQSKQAEWVQEINGQRNTFENPLQKAEQSARAIREVLFAAKIKQVPVETVVVFTGKNAELALPRSTGHYTPEQFHTYLKSVHFEEDNKVDVEQVAKLFEA